MVGLPLLTALCVLSIYADMVSRLVQFGVLQFGVLQFGVLQLAPPALVALALLALFNQGLARLTRRQWLGLRYGAATPPSSVSSCPPHAAFWMR